MRLQGLDFHSINEEWEYINEIRDKFPIKSQYIQLSGDSFVGFITRIHNVELTDSYVVDDCKDQVFFEINVISNYSEHPENMYKMEYAHPVLKYMNAMKCEHGETYSVGDKVKYYPCMALLKVIDDNVDVYDYVDVDEDNMDNVDVYDYVDN